MEIRILGAHNLETTSSHLVSMVIDGVLALDAGSLSSGLTLAEQAQIRAILLTHHHYDHIRDVPTLGLATMVWGTKGIYAPDEVLNDLSHRLLNGELYPDFTIRPTPEEPTFKLHTIVPRQPLEIEGYYVRAFPVPHIVPTVGYEVRDKEGKCLFYTSDTGPGLSSLWPETSPQLLITETTGSDNWEQAMIESGHLTPSLLKQELIEFQKQKGYLPRIVVLHMNPAIEFDIRAEIKKVAEELKADIAVAQEGMRLEL